MHFSIFGAFSSCISAATTPLACSSFDFLLHCTAASQLQVQQRNLCVVAILFFIFYFFRRWRFIFTSRLAQTYFLLRLTNQWLKMSLHC